MTSERDYAGAAAWCEGSIKDAKDAAADWANPDVTPDYSDSVRRTGIAACEQDATHATLARDAVRAWEAVDRSEVDFWRGKGSGAWIAVRVGPDGEWLSLPHRAPDPLSAVLAAMEAK